MGTDALDGQSDRACAAQGDVYGDTWEWRAERMDRAKGLWAKRSFGSGDNRDCLALTSSECRAA